MLDLLVQSWLIITLALLLLLVVVMTSQLLVSRARRALSRLRSRPERLPQQGGPLPDLTG